MRQPFSVLKNRATAVLFVLAAWFIFSAELSLAVLVVGVVVALLSVAMLPQDHLEVFSPRFFSRGVYLIVFLLRLLVKVFVASYKVAFLALHPGIATSTSIQAYDFQLESGIGILLLSTAITLTPGTFVLDINREKQRLYIHRLFHMGRESKGEPLEGIQHMESSIGRVFT